MPGNITHWPIATQLIKANVRSHFAIRSTAKVRLLLDQQRSRRGL